MAKIRKMQDEQDPMERLETFDSIIMDMKRDNAKTERAKRDFINMVRLEYGEELKNNPNSAKLIEKSFWEKIKERLIKIFELF